MSASLSCAPPNTCRQYVICCVCEQGNKSAECFEVLWNEERFCSSNNGKAQMKRAWALHKCIEVLKRLHEKGFYLQPTCTIRVCMSHSLVSWFRWRGIFSRGQLCFRAVEYAEGIWVPKYARKLFLEVLAPLSKVCYSADPNMVCYMRSFCGLKGCCRRLTRAKRTWMRG